MKDIYGNLDKTKCYCSKCFNKGIINELKIDEHDNNLIIPPTCGHYGSHFYKLIYNKNLNKWVKTKGSKIDQPIHKNPESFKHICPKCGKSTITKGSIYTCECGYSNKGLIHHVCNDCGFEEDTKGSSWVCPKCGNNDNLNRYSHHCLECGYEEINTIPDNVWTCPNCNNLINSEIICPNCKNKIIYKGTTYNCKNCGYTNKNLIHHICSNPNCGFEEDTKGSSWTCPKCGNNDKVTKFEHICENPNCNYKETNSQPINNWVCPKCGWCRKDHVHNLYNIGEHFYGSDHFTRINYCKSCDNETPHAIDSKENILYCRVCSGERVYDFYSNKYINIENFEKIEEIQLERNNKIKLLDKYNFSKNKMAYIQRGANNKNLTFEQYISTFIWCEHCQQWEDPDYNSIPEHWNKEDSEFFIVRIWKENHKEEVDFLEKNIIGFDKLLNGNNHCGIYRWYIDDIPYYFGQSIDIKRRSYEHFVNIVDYGEWWLNIFQEIKNGHSLKVKFDEYQENELDYWERYWILKERPISQKCTDDGRFDNIIPYEERDWNIKNLREKYEEKLKNV